MLGLTDIVVIVRDDVSIWFDWHTSLWYSEFTK